MMRRVGTALVGTAVLAALAGCAQQASFGLPELTPQGATAGVQVSPGYGYGSGVGYGYGYPSGYQPSYGYGDPYYAGQGPYPYGYSRYPYNPYPRYVVVPCADDNSDGRCDRKPPKDRDQHGNDGQNGGQNGNKDRDDKPVPPRYVRSTSPDAPPNTGNRARRGDAPVAQPRATPVPAPMAQPRSTPVPAPVVKQPTRARAETRRVPAPEQEP